LVKLEARKGRGPLFILVTSGPGGSRIREFSAPGFKPMTRWESKNGEQAVLLREEASPPETSR
jgi:hypothetical protein